MSGCYPHVVMRNDVSDTLVQYPFPQAEPLACCSLRSVRRRISARIYGLSPAQILPPSHPSIPTSQQLSFDTPLHPSHNKAEVTDLMSSAVEAAAEQLAAPISSNSNKIDFNKPRTMVSPVISEDILKADPPLHSLSGKNVLITGGAGGLGRAMAVLYISAGAYVTVGDLDVKGGEKLAKEYTRLEFRRCNVLSWEDQSALFKFAFERRGGLDIVVANAGITERGFINDDDLEKPGLFTLDINLRAQFLSSKLAHYYFRRNPKGQGRDRCLILTGSMASVGEIPGAPEYTAAKHGMLGLMRSLRRTSPSDGVRVNSIHPWFVETGIIDEREKILLAGTHFAKIEDVVRAAMMLSTYSTPSSQGGDSPLVNGVNGRAIAIMSPDLGLVDLFPSEDSAGDFKVFMDRVELGFALRSKLFTRISIVQAILLNLGRAIFKTGKGIPAALLAIYGLRRYFRSMRGQIMLMQLVQTYHSIKGTQ